MSDADLKEMGLIGGNAEAPVAAMSDEEAAVELMESINRSLQKLTIDNQALQIEVRSLQNRLATAETFVSYLLEKDPSVSERMKAMADAVAGSEKADKDEKQ